MAQLRGFLVFFFFFLWYQLNAVFTTTVYNGGNKHLGNIFVLVFHVFGQTDNDISHILKTQVNPKTF